MPSFRNRLDPKNLTGLELEHSRLGLSPPPVGRPSKPPLSLFFLPSTRVRNPLGSSKPELQQSPTKRRLPDEPVGQRNRLEPTCSDSHAQNRLASVTLPFRARLHEWKRLHQGETRWNSTSSPRGFHRLRPDPASSNSPEGGSREAGEDCVQPEDSTRGDRTHETGALATAPLPGTSLLVPPNVQAHPAKLVASTPEGKSRECLTSLDRSPGPRVAVHRSSAPDTPTPKSEPTGTQPALSEERTRWALSIPTQWSLSGAPPAHTRLALPNPDGALKSTHHSPTNLQADPREEDKRANSARARSHATDAQTQAKPDKQETRIVITRPLTPTAQSPKGLTVGASDPASDRNHPRGRHFGVRIYRPFNLALYCYFTSLHSDSLSLANE